MKKMSKIVGALPIIGLLLATLPGCTKPEGPAEKTGKAIDNAVDKTGQKIEKAGDKLQDTSHGKTP